MVEPIFESNPNIYKDTNVWTLGKTNPLNEQDLAEFVELQKTQAESENYWVVRISDTNQNTFDLLAKNPNTPEDPPLRSPEVILKEMAELDKESGLLM